MEPIKVMPIKTEKGDGLMGVYLTLMADALGRSEEDTKKILNLDI